MSDQYPAPAEWFVVSLKDIVYSDGPLGDPTAWRLFESLTHGAGYWLETGPSVATHTFVDDFTILSSGAPPAAGFRAYRVRTGPPTP